MHRLNRDNIRRAMVDSTYAWPTGHQVATFRALARRGQARETKGVCDGCAHHEPGTIVPVFELEAQ